MRTVYALLSGAAAVSDTAMRSVFSFVWAFVDPSFTRKEEAMTMRMIGFVLVSTFVLSALAMALPQVGFAQGAGRSLEFDGTDDYVNVGSMSIPSAYSIFLWVKPNDVGGYRIAFGKSGGSDPVRIQFKVSNNDWDFVYGDGKGVTGNSISVEQWQHLAVVVDGTSINTYRNGVFQKSGTAGPITVSSSTIYIGWNGVAGLKYSGTIDEVRIWNVALSQSTIRDWMCKKVTSDHPNWGNMVAYWKLDESSVSSPGHAGDSKGSYN